MSYVTVLIVYFVGLIATAVVFHLDDPDVPRGAEILAMGDLLLWPISLPYFIVRRTYRKLTTGHWK